MRSKIFYFGVYGFEMTRSINVGPFRLHPRTEDYNNAKNDARDSEAFNLTAIGECSAEVNSIELHGQLHDLSAAMTFCEQQWVAVTRPFADEEIGPPEKAMEQAKPRLEFEVFRPTSGPLIWSDTFAPDARRNFLELCLSKLVNHDFCEQTDFRPAFFRNVEIRRLRERFVDLTYYLDFSALEILARRDQNNYAPGNVAAILTPFLRNLGYNVQQSNHVDRHLGMENYAHVRNALFHNGRFEVTVNENGKQVTLRLGDYAGKLKFLLPDVLLKVMGYSDDYINWNRWLDRIPFKKQA
jgi:hypothetical protein